MTEQFKTWIKTIPAAFESEQGIKIQHEVLRAFVKEFDRRIDVVRQSKTGIYTIDYRGIFEQVVRDFGLKDNP